MYQPNVSQTNRRVMYRSFSNVLTFSKNSKTSSIVSGLGTSFPSSHPWRRFCSISAEFHSLYKSRTVLYAICLVMSPPCHHTIAPVNNPMKRVTLSVEESNGLQNVREAARTTAPMRKRRENKNVQKDGGLEIQPRNPSQRLRVHGNIRFRHC